MSRPVVRVERLAKRFPSGSGVLTVFSDVSFDLEPGESVALVGESGAGKSTLLHLLGALDAPSEGDILFGEESLVSASDRRLAEYRNREVGYVWQSYHLLPEFTALENVMMPLLIGGGDRRRVEAEAREWLARVGLAEREAHLAGELSGGEQQRVAIVRALIRRPKLLLADEPTGNLDERTGEGVIEQILALPREAHVAAVIATHNLGFASRCDRMMRVEGGGISEASPPQRAPI